MVATVLAAAGSKVSAQSPAAPGATVSREPLPIRVSQEKVRLSNYLHDLAGPGAFVGVIGGGLLDQVWQEPGVGNHGVDGFAGRVASRAGQAAVQVSVRHGLAALMNRSTDYQSCECQGFGRRVEHALLETFTDRGADGSRALSIPQIAGTYAGGLASLAWQRDRNPGDVALSTITSFGFKTLFNITRELTGLR
jgi:hypothetical protein